MSSEPTTADNNQLWLPDQQPQINTDVAIHSAVVRRPIQTTPDFDLNQFTQDGESPRFSLTELPMMGLLTLRVRPGHPNTDSASQDVLGRALPSKLRYWMSPDEWLLCVPYERTHAMEKAWQRALGGQFSIVNVTAGYIRYELRGTAANYVLAKGTGYDVHPENFPVGKVVNTTFAKTTATLVHAKPALYHMIVRRSYADYVWRWLQDSGTEANQLPID